MVSVRKSVSGAAGDRRSWRFAEKQDDEAGEERHPAHGGETAVQATRQLPDQLMTMGLTNPPMALALLMKAIPPALVELDRYVGGMVQNTAMAAHEPPAIPSRRRSITTGGQAHPRYVGRLLGGSQRRALPRVRAGRKTMAALHADWTSYNADERAASTIRRYTPSVESFVARLDDTDVRLVTEDDVWAWAELPSGRSTRTAKPLVTMTDRVVPACRGPSSYRTCITSARASSSVPSPGLRRHGPIPRDDVIHLSRFGPRSRLQPNSPSLSLHRAAENDVARRWMIRGLDAVGLATPLNSSTWRQPAV